MKTYRFPCREGIDTVDAFVEHIEITAYGMHIRNHRISLPIDYRDGILSIGIDGRSHRGGYWFVAKPRLSDSAILLEGSASHASLLPTSCSLFRDPKDQTAKTVKNTPS